MLRIGFATRSKKAFLSPILSVFNLFEYLIPKRYFNAKKRQIKRKINVFLKHHLFTKISKV